jgi:hypothetical protein
VSGVGEGWPEQLARAVEEAFTEAALPYRRPGSHLLLTAEQWELYDQAAALQERGVAGSAGWFRTRRLL